MVDKMKVCELWEIYTELDESGKEEMTTMLEECQKSEINPVNEE